MRAIAGGQEGDERCQQGPEGEEEEQQDEQDRQDLGQRLGLGLLGLLVDGLGRGTGQVHGEAWRALRPRRRPAGRRPRSRWPSGDVDAGRDGRADDGLAGPAVGGDAPVLHGGHPWARRRTASSTRAMAASSAAVSGPGGGGGHQDAPASWSGAGTAPPASAARTLGSVAGRNWELLLFSTLEIDGEAERPGRRCRRPRRRRSASGTARVKRPRAAKKRRSSSKGPPYVRTGPPGSGANGLIRRTKVLWACRGVGRPCQLGDGPGSGAGRGSVRSGCRLRRVRARRAGGGAWGRRSPASACG